MIMLVRLRPSDFIRKSLVPFQILYVGKHGFDDASHIIKEYLEGDFPDMRTIFWANGPAFKKGAGSTFCDQFSVSLQDIFRPQASMDKAC